MLNLLQGVLTVAQSLRQTALVLMTLPGFSKQGFLAARHGLLLAQGFQGICCLFDKRLKLGFLLLQRHALPGKAALLLLQIRQTLADIQRQDIILCRQGLASPLLIMPTLSDQLIGTTLIQFLFRHQPCQLTARVTQGLLGFIQLLVQQQHVIRVDDLFHADTGLASHQGFQFGPCCCHGVLLIHI